MCVSESERKAEVKIQAGRRDSDTRIPLRLTAALNPEVREERGCGETAEEYRATDGSRGKHREPYLKPQPVFACKLHCTSPSLVSTFIG